jgi:hypothetical protein
MWQSVIPIQYNKQKYMCILFHNIYFSRYRRLSAPAQPQRAWGPPPVGCPMLLMHYTFSYLSYLGTICIRHSSCVINVNFRQQAFAVIHSGLCRQLWTAPVRWWDVAWPVVWLVRSCDETLLIGELREQELHGLLLALCDSSTIQRGNEDL